MILSQFLFSVSDFVTDFVTDLVSDFVTDFVTHLVSDFVSDFVNKYFTSISYQIIYVLDTFCVPNFQIPNYNQLGHSTGIGGTRLGDIWYPQTLKRERNHYISVKLLQKTYFLKIFIVKYLVNTFLKKTVFSPKKAKYQKLGEITP